MLNKVENKKLFTFEAMINRVVSGLSFFSVLYICVPSMFDTKCTLGPVW